MTRALSRIACLAAPLALGLVACGDDRPVETTRVIIQQPQAVVPVAPLPPPPAHAELVPPPPSSSRTVWQPGHWRYTGRAGNPWEWQGGSYVMVPPGANTWVPGRWAPQPSGGWAWLEGHWA